MARTPEQRRKYFREWRRKNAEKVKAYHAEYRAANPDRIRGYYEKGRERDRTRRRERYATDPEFRKRSLAATKAWADGTRGTRAERGRRYYERNKAEVLAKGRQRYAANPEKKRAYAIKHRNSLKAIARRAFNQAVQFGHLVRPEACERCGVVPPRNRVGKSSVQGHHENYLRPFEVTWLCSKCHGELHRKHD